MHIETSSRGFKQTGWLPVRLRHGKLIDLRQMLEVYAEEYVKIGSAIQSVEDHYGVETGMEGAVSDSVRDAVLRALAAMLGSIRALNLGICLKTGDRIFAAYRNSAPSYLRVREDLRILKNVLHDEMEVRKFFFVPMERSDYYCSDDLFQERFGYPMQSFTSVVAAFPSTEYDAEESGNCFAFGRYTATVFHAMRIAEAGLKVTAKALGAKYTTDWGQCFRDIEKQGEQSDQFFKEAIAFLRSIKNVWRNPTMHIDRIYSEQEAKRILHAVQTFMAHLATRLAE